MTLPELITALEAAEGPSEQLDAEISHFLHEEDFGRLDENRPSTGWHPSTPAYTASLDAALTLVRNGFSWEVGQDITFYISAIVCGHDVHASAEGKTPALALSVAALKARASAAARELGIEL